MLQFLLGLLLLQVCRLPPSDGRAILKPLPTAEGETAEAVVCFDAALVVAEAAAAAIAQTVAAVVVYFVCRVVSRSGVVCGWSC